MMISVIINGEWLEIRHLDPVGMTMVVRSVRL
jgi:hypothetical protein